MTYLRFNDEVDGIHVHFVDVTDAGPLPTTATFNDYDIATFANRAVDHNIKFSIDFVSGAGNDVVRIYIDNVLTHTGTTWEDYFRYDAEQTGGGNVVPVTDAMIFPVRGTAAPANAGNGYLFDNLSLASSDTVQCTTTCYVDDNGNDAFSGTSIGDAKKTIQAGIDAVAMNGFVRVLPGTYSETAADRDIGHDAAAATYQFGLFFPMAKPGITVMGVTSGDVPITNANATAGDGEHQRH